jgi:hypothetical protein
MKLLAAPQGLVFFILNMILANCVLPLHYRTGIANNDIFRYPGIIM